MFKRLLFTALAFGTCAAAVSAAKPCTISAPDQAWLNLSMAAWDYAANHLSGIGHVKTIKAVKGDDLVDCDHVA